MIIKHRKIGGQAKCICGSKMLYIGRQFVCLEILKKDLKTYKFKLKKIEAIKWVKELTKKDYLKIYKGLPPNEKRNVICVIDGEPCSWRVVDLEVRFNTKMSKKMLKQIGGILDWRG